MKHRLIFIFILVSSLQAFTLREAQQQLFANNSELTIAAKELTKSRDALKETKASWYPSLDASGSYSYITKRGEARLPFQIGPSPTSLQLGTNNKTEFGIDLSYPLFTGFSRYYAVKSSNVFIESKQKVIESTKNRLNFNLAILYLQWTFSFRQHQLRQIFVNQLQQQSEQAQNLFNSGVIARASLLQTNALLQNAKSDLLGASIQSDSLKLEILNVIGSKDATIAPDLQSFPFDSSLVPGAIDTSRADLQILELTIKQLNFSEKVLFGSRYPSIAGFAGYRVANPGLSMNGNQFMDYGIIGVQAKWNIFDGFKNRAQRQQIKDQAEITAINRTQVIDNLNKSLAQQKEQILRAEARIEAASQSLSAAQDYENAIKINMENGTSTRTDYLNAMTSRAQSELSLELAIFTKRVGILSAMFSSGQTIVF